MTRHKCAQGVCRSFEKNIRKLTYILSFLAKRDFKINNWGYEMFWILGAVLIGLCVGYISYAFQKLFLGAMVLAFPIMGIVYFRVMLPLAKVSGLGQGDPITVILEIIGQLPQDIQSAITLFPIAAFGGRLITWVYAKFIAKAAVEESSKDRKNRILEQFGYKDGMPY